MRILGALVVLCALLALGCGPDSELVASGKNHKCKLQALAGKLEAEPGNAEIQEEIKMVADDLRAVIETADDEKRPALQDAIDKAYAAGCD